MIEYEYSLNYLKSMIECKTYKEIMSQDRCELDYDF